MSEPAKTLDDLPPSVRRALATQASLMRLRIGVGRMYIGAGIETTTGHTVLIVHVKDRGEVRESINAGRWEGRTLEDGKADLEAEIIAVWSRATALWNDAPQPARDAFWFAHKPNDLDLVKRLFVAGLLPDRNRGPQ